MDKIAVLIPCYNEGQTIAKVVKDYREALPEATIYVYDNNSSEHTDEIAREAGAVVRYEYQQGKGNVIRSMFRGLQSCRFLGCRLSHLRSSSSSPVFPGHSAVFHPLP